jgi:hypothetical protein
MKNGSALFIGDSYTWGQNLYYKEWLKNRDDLVELHEYTESKMVGEFEDMHHSNYPVHRCVLSQDDYNFMCQNRASKLICDELNLHELYFAKEFSRTGTENGGENLDNLLRFYTWWEEYNKWLKIEDKLLSDRKLKLVVFQLTYAERTPIEWLYQLQYAWIRGALNHLERVDFEDIKKDRNFTVIFNTVKLLDGLYSLLKEHDIKFIVWSGTQDWFSVTDKEYFTKLFYNGKSVDNFEDAFHATYEDLDFPVVDNQMYSPPGMYTFGDNHPSYEFQKVICNSVVKKYRKEL